MGAGGGLETAIQLWVAYTVSHHAIILTESNHDYRWFKRSSFGTLTEHSAGSLSELVCLSSLNVHVATKGSGYQSLHCEWSIFPALVYYPVKKVIRACTNTVLLYLNTSTLFPDSANSPIFSTRTSELFFSSGTICGSNRIYFSPAKTSTFHCIY